MIHLLAVLGNPVEHSRSPEIHRAFARQAGIGIRYEKIPVPAGLFEETARHFLDRGATGFNITVPCKTDAYRMADSLSARARRCGAVNTIVRDGEGRLYGDNTDGAGLLRDLTRNLDWKVAGSRVLVLGAGGAVRGVVRDLLAASPEELHLYNRTHARAAAIAEELFDARCRALGRAELDRGYDLIINGTSASLGGETLDLPETVLNAETRCYDLMYGPSMTPFCRWCREIAGCPVSDGLGMLVEQAALAFRLWFETPVETTGVLALMRGGPGPEPVPEPDPAPGNPG